MKYSSSFKALWNKLFLVVWKGRQQAQSNLSQSQLVEKDLTPEYPQPIYLSDTEKRIRNLWAEILNITPYGIEKHDDFFTCGGSIPSVLQLSDFAWDEGILLSPRDIFEHPRLEHLANQAQLNAESTNFESIPRFSLLTSSIDEQRVRFQAAQLCHVKQSQVLDILPSTPLQAGMLALTQLDPGQYVEQNLFEIDRPVDLEKFRAAWDQVVAMNPILRTRIVSLPGHDIVQVVLNEEVQWIFEESLEQYRQRYPVEKSGMGLWNPLTRFAIIGRGKGPRYFIWDIHHALYDGWSLPLVLKDAEHTYYQDTGPRLLSMSGLIKYIQEINEIESMRFWSNYFSGVEGAHFPTDKVICLDHHSDMQQKIHQVSNLDWGHSSFTPATIVRAAWAVVIAKRTKSNEALYGVTVTGRQAALSGLEHMAGPAIATVPVRVQIDWERSVGQLLEKVQSQAADMIPFEQTGLQTIRRISDKTRVGCNFRSLLVIHPKQDSSETSDERPFLSGVHDSGLAIGEHASGTYPIEIECQLSSHELDMQIDFDSHVIQLAEIDGVANEFGDVVRQLARCSNSKEKLDGPVASTLVPTETLSQVFTWNAHVPDPMESIVHHIIERRTRESPDAPAICAWDGELTYQELDNLSSQLADQLAEIPVAGSLVSLLFEKSLWMPVAAVAVMKAGGAVTALEMAQPEERLKEIVAQTSSSVLLCSIQNTNLASSLGAKRVVVVGKDLYDSKQQSFQPPVVCPGDLLYVVFTSGSSGTPKGVRITHRNICSAIAYQQAALRYNVHSRVFDFASYAFDVAWSNLFNALTAGACLCIPSAHERQNNLGDCLIKYDVNYMDTTPSLARTLGKEVISRLSTLILGGEAMLPSDALLAGDQTKIINAYGPAECTPTALVSDQHANGIQIGRGLGACTWIVDTKSDRLVPVGEVGELWLEGPIVGDGYLNDTAKTATAFILDPAWLVHQVGRSGRVYRTGDLVRYEPDGSLVYIGRKDQQVKIRGQRVEPGEVENTIERVLQSAKARVVAETVQVTDDSSLVLVAFVTLHGADTMTEAEHDTAVKQITDGLVDTLAQTLPSYMIPAAFFSMPAVPVTTTGKTDRRQLREKGKTLFLAIRANHTAQGKKDEVFNKKESVLQTIWISVLNLLPEEATLDADFARVGGDSISAMQVVTRCRMHNLQLTVSDVLQSRTIRNLAARCQDELLQGPSVDKFEVEDPAAPSELSPIQKEFFDLYPDGLNHYNQSFLLDLGEAVPAATVRLAMDAIVSRHAMLRARFHKDPGTGLWKQKIADSGPLSFGFAEHSVAGRAAAGGAAQWRQENLNIRDGPVFACDLFNLPCGEQMLLLSAHHLVIDLVSWRILWGDLEDHIRYGSLRPSQTMSFQGWCAYQARVGRMLSPLEVLPYGIPESQLDFWGVPLEENTFGQCESLAVTFPPNISQLVFGNSNSSLRTEGVDLVLGALIHAFAHTFPERSVPAVWTESHGREQFGDHTIDASETIGWFTAIFPLVVPITSSHSPAHVVRLVKDIRRKVPGKGQPFSACRFNSESGRQAFQGHSIVEIVFNFTGRFQQLEKEDGLLQAEKSTTEEECAFTQISESAQRPSMIDLDLDVTDGQLGVSFTVHKQMDLDRIRGWIRRFSKDLEDLSRNLAQAPVEFTLSDFPLLSWSYRDLDTLVQKQFPQMGVKAASVIDLYPCSPLQEGMLLSAMKGTAFYQTFTIWRCILTDAAGEDTKVCPSKLEKAWKAVVSRHSILSSVFTLHPDGNGFIQVVLDKPPISVKQMTAECEDPATPLLKMENPSFAPNEPQHVLSISQSTTGEVSCRLDINHTLTDAHSESILLSELASAYEGTELATAPAFSEIIQHINKNPKAKVVASWAALLEGVEPCYFPVSSLGPQRVGPVTFGEISHSSPIFKVNLNEFCKSAGVMVSSFMHVAWAMVLSCYTGISDVCFGYDVSGRDAPIDGVEKLVGPLANLLISRVNLSAQAKDVLQFTSTRAGQNMALQNVSMADIHNRLGLSGKQLFNTSLSVRDNATGESASKKGISFHALQSEDAHEVWQT